MNDTTTTSDEQWTYPQALDNAALRKRIRELAEELRYYKDLVALYRRESR